MLRRTPLKRGTSRLKKSPLKKLPKASNKKLKAEADKIFSLVIRRAGRCRRCGKTIGLQCAHIISRSYLATRWDIDNAICLCQGCHMYFTYHPLEWEVYICNLFGEDKWRELKQRALASDYSLDYEAIIARLVAL